MNSRNPTENKQHNRKTIPKGEVINRKLLQLVDCTGYPIVQTNGQRTYGPPHNWVGPLPQRGSEIFVGKIPKYIFEDELVPIFQRVGPIYRMRLMMDFCGMNRGYAFISYSMPEYANLAITYLNNYEIRPNRYIGVYKSIDNCRLFLGGIPQEKFKMEIWQMLNNYVEGITDVIMYPANASRNEGISNRGYVFVEFDSHRSAAIARRLLGAGVKLWDTPVAVDWADPLPELDVAIMEKVSKLYIRNIDIGLTNHALLLEITKYVPSVAIVRVHKIADYAFVHFASRKDAEHAFQLIQGAVIAGKEIEVSWARPRIYSKSYRMNMPAQNFCTSVPPRMRKLVQLQKPLKSGERADTNTSPSFSGSSQSLSPPLNMGGAFRLDLTNPFMTMPLPSCGGTSSSSSSGPPF